MVECICSPYVMRLISVSLNFEVMLSGSSRNLLKTFLEIKIS